MHEHKGCDHELQYCSHCDVVYCKKCKHEWGQQKTEYIPYAAPVYPSYPCPWWEWRPGTIWMIGAGAELNGGMTYSTVGCSHT